MDEDEEEQSAPQADSSDNVLEKLEVIKEQVLECIGGFREDIESLKYFFENINGRTDKLELRMQALNEHPMDNRMPVLSENYSQSDVATKCTWPQVQVMVAEAFASVRANWKSELDDKLSAHIETKSQALDELFKDIVGSVASHEDRLAVVELKLTAMGMQLEKMQSTADMAFQSVHGDSEAGEADDAKGNNTAIRHGVLSILAQMARDAVEADAQKQLQSQNAEQGTLSNSARSVSVTSQPSAHRRSRTTTLQPAWAEDFRSTLFEYFRCELKDDIKNVLHGLVPLNSAQLDLEPLRSPKEKTAEQLPGSAGHSGSMPILVEQADAAEQLPGSAGRSGNSAMQMAHSSTARVTTVPPEVTITRTSRSPSSSITKAGATQLSAPSLVLLQVPQPSPSPSRTDDTSVFIGSASPPQHNRTTQKVLSKEGSAALSGAQSPTTAQKSFSKEGIAATLSGAQSPLVSQRTVRKEEIAKFTGAQSPQSPPTLVSSVRSVRTSSPTRVVSIAGAVAQQTYVASPSSSPSLVQRQISVPLTPGAPVFDMGERVPATQSASQLYGSPPPGSSALVQRQLSATVSPGSVKVEVGSGLPSFLPSQMASGSEGSAAVQVGSTAPPSYSPSLVQRQVSATLSPGPPTVGMGLVRTMLPSLQVVSMSGTQRASSPEPVPVAQVLTQTDGAHPSSKVLASPPPSPPAPGPFRGSAN